MRRITRALNGVAIAAALPVGPAAASIVDIQLDTARFGRVNSAAVGLPPGSLGDAASVPAAMVNGFIYLQNQYPAYAGRLVPGDPVATANTLAYGFLLTGGADTGGGDPTSWIDGQKAYMESAAPGVTVYEAVSAQYTGMDQTVRRALPDWLTLARWLKQGAFIELHLLPSSFSSPFARGYSIALTSFHWNDANDDGVIQKSEGAQIDLLDPNDPDHVRYVNIWQAGPNTALQTDFQLGNEDTVIVVGVATLPSPGAAAIAGLGLAFAGRRRR